MVDTIRLAEAQYKKNTILGFWGAGFEPLTQLVWDSISKVAQDVQDQYPAVQALLDRQTEAAEALIASGKLQDPEWIRANIHVLTDDEIAQNEVYEWLNSYVQTPEGQANLAYALVNEAGGADNQMSIRLGTREELNGAGGWASWGDSHVQLSEESWKNSGEWNRNNVLPHEIRHVGQQDIPNLSQREWFLYHALIVEADARLTEYCDGVTEGRNQHGNGYDESLREVFEREILPKRDQFLSHTTFGTWDEFIQTKESDPETYKRVMGRIKEVQFKAVLNKLATTLLYQRQGDYCSNITGTGNLPGLYAWCKKMCERQGMRIDHVWPLIQEMATGQREIPGMEECFTADGKINKKGVGTCEMARLCLDDDWHRTVLEDGTIHFERDDGCVREFKDNKLCREVTLQPDGTETEYSYDSEGNVSREVMINKNYRGTCKTVYEYDSEGNRCGHTLYQYNSKGKLIKELSYDKQNRMNYKIEYSYDRSGRQTAVVTDKHYQIVDRIIRSFDENDRVVQEVHNMRRNYQNITYTYDAAGEKTKETYKDNYGSVIKTKEYTYDNEGHSIVIESDFEKRGSIITKQTTKDSKGEELYTEKYTHDNNGNKTGMVRTDKNDDVLYTEEYTNDNKGNATCAVRKDKNGKVINTYEYTYDSNGNRIGVVHRDGNGKVIDGFGPMYEEALKKQKEDEKKTEAKENTKTERRPKGYTASKNKNKRYCGRRPGGMDDAIVEGMAKELAKTKVVSDKTKKC